MQSLRAKIYSLKFGKKFKKNKKKFLKQKHEPACKKITKMHRKVFDSGKQRAANSDIPYKDIKKVIKEKEKVCEIFNLIEFF